MGAGTLFESVIMDVDLLYTFEKEDKWDKKWPFDFEVDDEGPEFVNLESDGE